MSLLLAALGAVTSTPLPTLAPSVTPVATPVLQAVQTAAPAAQPGVLDAINAFAARVSQTDIVAVGALLGVVVQGSLNKLPFLKHAVEWVQDARRVFVAVVLPFVVALGASLATGQNDLHLAPWLFLVGQVLFYAARSIQKKGNSEPGPAASPATSTLPRTSNP